MTTTIERPKTQEVEQAAAGNPAGWPSFVVDSGLTPARWLPAL
jgi:hypothetical protein